MPAPTFDDTHRLVTEPGPYPDGETAADYTSCTDCTGPLTEPCTAAVDDLVDSLALASATDQETSRRALRSAIDAFTPDSPTRGDTP